MKLVHLADLHLGYRAYHRTGSTGINIREADVARAFREALQEIREIRPAFLLIAGDVFHTVRPSNSAIADAFRQLAKVHSDLPETRVIVIAGNHDSPRAAETGSILRLFDEIPGVYVVHHEARRLAFPEIDAAVLCMPHSELRTHGAAAGIHPSADFGYNILLAHGEVDDARLNLLMDFGAARLSIDTIDPDAWDYVALGNYHVRVRLAPNVYYSGAIERTGLNIWAEGDAMPGREKEVREFATDTWPEAPWGKGFVEYDLDSKLATFHALESPRPVFDLRPIIRGDEEPEELDALIASAIEEIPGGIEGKIVRLRIFELPRDVYRHLDHRRIREIRTEALHFHLDPKPPKAVRFGGSAAPGRRLTLEEELKGFLEGRWTPSTKSVDVEAMVKLGTRYLREADDATAPEVA